MKEDKTMTFTEAIEFAIEKHFNINLEAEQKRGKANQVDFIGFSSQIGEIRIELERRREDPLNNVVKAWRQAMDAPNEQPFTLIHIFSGFYVSKKSKFENANFVGERMNDWAKATNHKIRYIAVLLEFTPPSKNSNPILTNDEIQKICDQIDMQIQSNL